MSCCTDNCDREGDKYNLQINGSPIPCKHQILLQAKPILLEIQNDITQKNIKCSLKSILNQILSSKFMKIRPNDKVNEIKDIIFQSQSETRLINQDLLVKLVEIIRNCFDYPIPDYPEFDIKWNIHEVHEFNAKERIEFDSNNRRGHKPYSFKVSKEDKAIWISNCKTLHQKIAKKALYETTIEIIKIYPELNDTTIPFSICFDEFLSIIDFKDDMHILNSIPLFKIRCWRAADNFMKSKKFSSKFK